MLRPKGRTQIDWIYRNMGELAPVCNMHSLPPDELTGDGYYHICDAGRCRAGNDLVLDWYAGSLGTRLLHRQQAGNIAAYRQRARQPTR